jgi:hypothetical protein
MKRKYVDRDEQERETEEPFGHWCDGLQKYYEQSEFLVPMFSASGIIEGETSSTAPITFCPFCGLKINPKKS